MAIDWSYRAPANDAVDRFGAGFDQGLGMAQDQQKRKAISAYLPDAMQGNQGAVRSLAKGAPDVAAELMKLRPADREKSTETWAWVGTAVKKPDGSLISTPEELRRVQTLAKARGIDPKIVDSITIEHIPTLSMFGDQARTFAQEMQLRQAGATSVTVNNAGEKEFEKKVGGAQADMFAEIAKDGIAAKSDLASIGELSANLAKTPGGLAGGLQQFALSWGVPLGEGATEAQAANAIISKLVPSQRPPGSGPMSDRDVLLFKDSLPKLVNTREGNALIVKTMQAMAEYRIKQSNIASAAMTGEISRAEATQALNNLPDPLAAFKASRKTGGGDMPGEMVGGGKLSKPRTPQDYDNLKSGTKFMAPDGSIRTKP